GNLLNVEMVKSMADDSIIFAMANPDPEIMPELAREGGAKIIATGRSDLPNQINNVLIFPGLFRGVLDGKHKVISEGMKIACAEALAGVLRDDEISFEKVIADPFDSRVVKAVSETARDYKE
ncbi:MAG: malate dehydrogenase (oxaloacetate-decarboxylating), partial [Patescibacteria group bacterium]